MNTFTRQIHSINTNIIASIVDKYGDILYLSKSMQHMITSKSTQFNNFTANPTLEDLNDQVIQAHNTIKYIYIMQTDCKKFTIFNCTKHPIYKNNSSTPDAILTIQEPFKLIDLSTIKFISANLIRLSEIKQVILFCASLNLSHGKIYQFITKHYDETMKFKQYKSYCNDLLKIFLSSTLHELVNNNDILQYCSSILPELLKNGLFFLKSYK
ncbi:MAG: hypothetical protein ACK5WP_09370 [Neisseriaceae bacterium]